MEDITNHIPDILNSVTDVLKLGALVIVAALAMALLLFRNSKASIKLAVFLCVVGLSFGVFFLLAQVDPKGGETDIAEGAFTCGTIDVDRTTDKWLAVRFSHTTESAMKSKLFDGQLVYAYDRDGNWIKIRADKNGERVDGWVYASYVAQHPCS